MLFKRSRVKGFRGKELPSQTWKIHHGTLSRLFIASCKDNLNIFLDKADCFLPTMSLLLAVTKDLKVNFKRLSGLVTTWKYIFSFKEF